MTKFFHCVEAEWVEHVHPPVFRIEKPLGQSSRLIAAVPAGDPAILRRLVDCLTPPFVLLYVLHTPRGEGAAGRYQSPEISKERFESLLRRFGDYFANDCRFDLWVRSPEDRGMVVWDRHNLIHVYGSIEAFAGALRGLGYSEGEPSIPSPHEHHYRAEFDRDAKALLHLFDWSFSELWPEDEQV